MDQDGPEGKGFGSVSAKAKKPYGLEIWTLIGTVDAETPTNQSTGNGVGRLCDSEPEGGGWCNND